MVKASDTGGVKPMPIAGRYIRERERLLGMTDAERAFRKQWLKDQELSPNEPRLVPEYQRELMNPIRRLYRWPLDTLQSILKPMVGDNRALMIRYFGGKALMGIAFAYITTYYFKYNANDWTRKSGWKVLQSKKAVVEGDPNYPQCSDRTEPSHYNSRGFNEVTLKL